MKFNRRWLGNRTFKRFMGVAKWTSDVLANHTTANRITIFGMLLCIPTLTAFWLGDLFIYSGAVSMVISMITDFVDGVVAHAQQGTRPVMTLEEELRLTLRERVNYRGVTHLGKALDPFADKVRLFVVLFPLGFEWVHTWVVVSILMVAIALTVIRPLKQYWRLDDVSANRFGKYKMIIEVVGSCLLVLLPVTEGTAIIINTIFVCALLGGLLSLGGSILTGYLAYRRRLGPLAGTLRDLDTDTDS